MSPARRVVNLDIIEFSKLVPKNVLFIGVDRRWDYSNLFQDYVTSDINPETKPTFVDDIRCSKLKEGSFDGVIMTGVYEFLDYNLDAFYHINRILKCHGKAYLGLAGKGYYSDKPTVNPWDAWWTIKPLLMEKMNITYYKTEVPYYLNIFAKKC